MAALRALLARLDADERVSGRQWERLCAWFLAHDPGYRSLLRRVWLWGEWPGRWGADAGIDLVAEDMEGRLWAVQAKAYDPAYTVTKRDLDTFLSESSRPQFGFRLLMATTDLLAPNARRVVEGSEKPVGLLLRGDLERAQVEWPEHPDDLRAPAPVPKIPRPHQQEALDAILAGFGGQERGQLIMACGTGKTLVGLWAAEALAATRTLVLLPSLSLLAQVLGEWTANASERFPFLPVCSDPTVRGEDEWVSTTADLGFPVTTDPAEIAAFLRRRGRRVVFSTYQSSPRIAEAQALDRVPGFDLVIADEAHRTAGETSTDFATILDSDSIRAKRRLFMTATPRFFTGRVLKAAEEADLEVASMDDEARYGPVFHRLTFGEAISRDLLSDYRVVIVGVDDPTVHQMAQEARLVRLEGSDARTDARTLAAHIGLAKTMRRFDLRRTITFHGRVKGARDFASRLPQVVAWMPADQAPEGSLWAEHVSGEMPTGQRTTRLQRLRHLGPGERGVLSNARCLAEGVDVPTLDGVAFIDPKGSQTDIVQAVGRAIRKAEDKTLGTIVLPVFIEHSDDPERALEASAFKPVWAVLRALRDQDERLAEELDAMRRGLRPAGLTNRLPGKVSLDLPDTVGLGFVSALRTRLVEAATASWESWYGLLGRFIGREGHARVPQRHTEDGARLGVWVAKQRRDHAWGVLEPARVARLEAIPGWQWEEREARWADALEALRLFATREGHARVPRGWKEGDIPLGAWVTIQRMEHRNGGLSRERQAALEAVPGWEWEPTDAAWERAFGLLVGFVEREGHSRVPTGHREQGFRLGGWVQTQRGRRARGSLPDSQAQRLAALPDWSWDINSDQWEQGYERLVAFTRREGHAQVPIDHLEDGVRLGHWLFKQRQAWKAGRLGEERALRLEVLPGWVWEPREAWWEEGYRVLSGFAAREGHAQVPGHFMEGDFPLGQWVLVQRMAYKAGKVTAARIDLLERLPGWSWQPRDDRWERGFAMLEEHVRREGHARVPQLAVVNGFRLGSWVTKQRTNHRNGTLSADRAARLEALPGWERSPTHSPIRRKAR
jgi:superfamily II DNA or RNA helicase